MNKSMKAIAAFLFILMSINTSNVFSQTKNTTNGRQVGVNLRNAWIGGSLELLHRRQKEADRWRRFDVSLLPYFNSSRIGESIGSIMVPNEFRYQSNNTFTINYQTVNEHYTTLFKDVDFYHGPLLQFGYTNTGSKRTYGNFAEITYEKNVSQGIILGAGYLAGVRFALNSKFSIGMDTDLKFQLRGNVVDTETQIYNDATKIITQGNDEKGLFTSSFGIASGPTTRIWILFNIN